MVCFCSHPVSSPGYQNLSFVSYLVLLICTMFKRAGMLTDHLWISLKDFSVRGGQTGRALGWEQGATPLAQGWPSQEASRMGAGTLHSACVSSLLLL